MSKYPIINMWAGPRNISTTMMYSFAQRPDMEVVDEPLYAHYLHKTGVNHPGREEVLASQPLDGQAIMEGFLKGEASGGLFIKNMGQHYLELDGSRFLGKMKQFFLIRKPEQVIHSFSKVIPNPGLSDIGIARQWEIFEEIKTLGVKPLVVDSNEVLKNPREVLTRLCHALDLEFREEMLSWPQGGRKEDGVWAPYWYARVHESTGFGPYQENRKVELPRELRGLEEEARPYYERLYDASIHALSSE